MFPCIAFVMPFSGDTLTELTMTLVRLSAFEFSAVYPVFDPP